MSTHEPERPTTPETGGEPGDDVEIDPALLPEPGEPGTGDEDIETWEEPGD